MSTPWSWHRQGGRQVEGVGWGWRWTEDGRGEEGKGKEMKKERREVVS